MTPLRIQAPDVAASPPSRTATLETTSSGRPVTVVDDVTVHGPTSPPTNVTSIGGGIPRFCRLGVAWRFRLAPQIRPSSPRIRARPATPPPTIVDSMALPRCGRCRRKTRAGREGLRTPDIALVGDDVSGHVDALAPPGLLGVCLTRISPSDRGRSTSARSRHFSWVVLAGSTHVVRRSLDHGI